MEKNEERIQQASAVVDQKVKDKMIDMERIHQEVKNIQVTIHDRINENKAFQHKLDKSHEKAKITIGHLLKAINNFTLIKNNFAKHLANIKSKRTLLRKEMSVIKQQSVEINQEELDKKLKASMKAAQQDSL